MPLCVYAIVGSRAGARALRPRSRRPHRLVKAGPVAAIVAECAGGDPLSARSLRAYDAAIRNIAKHVPAVLPARFSTVVESEPALIGLLTRWSADLLTALALVNRREQMTLRVFAAGAVSDGQSAAGVSAVEAVPEEVAREAGSGRPGTRYLARRARVYAQSKAPELEPLRQALGPVVKAERIVRHDRGPLLLTAYHLIPRGAATGYRRLLRRHANATGTRTVLSGPWPPYAFVPELRG
jgi:hypothetical protein